MEKQILIERITELAKDSGAIEEIMAIRTQEEAEKYLKDNHWDASLEEIKEAIQEYISSERELSEIELDQAAGGAICGSSGSSSPHCFFFPGSDRV